MMKDRKRFESPSTFNDNLYIFKILIRFNRIFKISLLLSTFPIGCDLKACRFVKATQKSWFLKLIARIVKSTTICSYPFIFVVQVSSTILYYEGKVPTFYCMFPYLMGILVFFYDIVGYSLYNETTGFIIALNGLLTVLKQQEVYKGSYTNKRSWVEKELSTLLKHLVTFEWLSKGLLIGCILIYIRLWNIHVILVDFLFEPLRYFVPMTNLTIFIHITILFMFIEILSLQVIVTSRIIATSSITLLYCWSCLKALKTLSFQTQKTRSIPMKSISVYHCLELINKQLMVPSIQALVLITHVFIIFLCTMILFYTVRHHSEPTEVIMFMTTVIFIITTTSMNYNRCAQMTSSSKSLLHDWPQIGVNIRAYKASLNQNLNILNEGCTSITGSRSIIRPLRPIQHQVLFGFKIDNSSSFMMLSTILDELVTLLTSFPPSIQPKIL